MTPPARARRGAPIGTTHTRKLTPEQRAQIRDDPRRPLRVIAADYGVSKMTVSHIKRGVTGGGRKAK